MKTVNNRLRIALQKSGRLSEESFNLLSRCGLKVKQRKEQLFCFSENFPLDVLLVRDDDIPGLVAEGVCDLGIVGTNILQENLLQKNSDSNTKVTVEIINYLDFGFCRLVIAVPENFSYEKPNDLNQKRIATSYPKLLQAFLKQNAVSAEIVALSGSVEVAPKLGIADVICDLVSTGATLEANNLIEAELIFKSQAVLIKTTQALNDEKQNNIDCLQNRLAGVLQANDSKYIMLHAPKAALARIIELLPGSENPTIMPLQNNDEKLAVHALCRESVFWETMEQLKKAGASSILVVPVEKMLV